MNDTLQPTDLSPLDRAIACLDTQDALAAALGVKSPSITGWKNRGKVPAERCIDIERLTRARVTRYDLRPDVFGADPAKRRSRKQEAA